MDGKWPHRWWCWWTGHQWMHNIPRRYKVCVRCKALIRYGAIR